MSAETGQIIGWSAVYGYDPSPKAHAVRLERCGEYLVAAPACGAKVVLCGALESEPLTNATLAAIRRLADEETSDAR